MTGSEKSDRTERALRFARWVKILVAAFAALSVMQYIVIAVFNSYPAATSWPIIGSLESVIWTAWLASFMTILPAAVIWLAVFGWWAKSERRLRNSILFMIIVTFAWFLLVIGFLVLIAYLAQGLINSL